MDGRVILTRPADVGSQEVPFHVFDSTVFEPGFTFVIRLFSSAFLEILSLEHDQRAGGDRKGMFPCRIENYH